jgi:uncharacterized protein (DUF1015 family)
MPRFEPFAALRYSTHGSTDITALTSAPYDVFDEDQRAAYASTDPHNIVLLDYPIHADGPSRYQLSADRLNEWRNSGHIVSDDSVTFSIYRMTFTDEAGTTRTTVGVIGALEVCLLYTSPSPRD